MGGGGGCSRYPLLILSSAFNSVSVAAPTCGDVKCRLLSARRRGDPRSVAADRSVMNRPSGALLVDWYWS